MQVSNRPYRRLGQFSAVLAAAVTALVAIGGPAQADDDFVYSPPDGGGHNYCYGSSLPSVFQTHISESMYTLIGSTEVPSAARGTCNTTAASGQTDVQWEGTGDLGSTTFGRAQCAKWYNSKCDRYVVNLNKGAMDTYATNDANQYRKTACHELGHTAGGSHYAAFNGPVESTSAVSPDCLVSGIQDSGNTASKTYNSHHRTSHFNKFF
ncbi:hypothetical protein [Actinoplanes sp. CA-252034]|uniref:hypothetical protein n=1 Tax=Actinoplanes sp. CA-252034 TaxID=3239906 RepID=UPI003D96609A